MTDPAAEALGSEAPATPEPPALTAAQIEALIDRKAQEISDKRVAGLQSLFDKKIAEQAAKLSKFQKSFSNEEDDGVDPRVAELEAELARVQREAELAAAQREYSDVFDVFTELESRQSTTDRLAYLRELQTRLTASQTAAEEPAPEPEIPTPPVHPNQPAREPKGWVPGTPMDARTAEEFFKGLDRWPGY